MNNVLEGHSSNLFLSSCNKIQNLQHILTVRGDLKIETTILIQNGQSQIATVHVMEQQLAQYLKPRSYSKLN